MGIIPEDNIEKGSIHLLMGRLSKIASDPNHHGADQARKLYEEGLSLQGQPHPDSPKKSEERAAQGKKYKKRIELFLKQNE